MLLLARKVDRTRTPDLGPSHSVIIDRLDFRSALVIEESIVLRSSIVQLLKKRGWIAHGIKVSDQAFPLLKCIPYRLIVIDGSASNIAAVNFASTLHSSEEWNKVPLVIITDSPSDSLAPNLNEARVYSAKRSTWLPDLIKILADVEANGRWKRQTYAS